MTDLENGFTVKTKNGKTVKVIEKLGEGGQGAVYKVEYAGTQKALKWYESKKLKDKVDKFYNNLENNVERGAPNSLFLWPEAVTEQVGEDKNFGYIMKLRPSEYKDFSQILKAKEKFAGLTPLVNTALQITSAFYDLHHDGFNYQDLNAGNFFVNPKTGDVLICDNDNVTGHGKNMGILGTPEYMAPEIVVSGGKTQPSTLTDRFSLAVILFMLFCMDHPLKGKKYYSKPCLTPDIETELFGKNPVFMFDQTDSSNAPVANINRNALKFWNKLLPRYIKDLFLKAFGKEAIRDPNRRLLEKEWLRAFIRLRGEIFKCSCGEVFFAAEGNPCYNCGKANVFPAYIKLAHYTVPVHQRTKLYAAHTESDSGDYVTVTAESVESGKALKNLSDKIWTVINGGTQTQVKNGEMTPVKKGVQINFGAADGEIV